MVMDDPPTSSQAALDAAAFRAEFRATLEAYGHGCELMGDVWLHWQKKLTTTSTPRLASGVPAAWFFLR